MNKIKDFLDKDMFAKKAGIELLECSEGYARASMRIQPMHLNAGGVCQGGAIFTLADLALAAAMNSHGRLTLTTNCNINFFRAEKDGLLYAEAREIFNHDKLSSCEVRVTNESGELVALVSGNGYRKTNKL